MICGRGIAAWWVRKCARFASACLRRVLAEQHDAAAELRTVLVVDGPPQTRADAWRREAAVDACMAQQIAEQAHVAYEAGDFAKARRLSDAAITYAHRSIAQSEVAAGGAALVGKADA